MTIQVFCEWMIWLGNSAIRDSHECVRAMSTTAKGSLSSHPRRQPNPRAARFAASPTGRYGSTAAREARVGLPRSR
jgi:hypothetical protein